MLAWLERTGNPVEDMLRWKKRWIRLGERLHPGDYAESFMRRRVSFQPFHSVWRARWQGSAKRAFRSVSRRSLRWDAAGWMVA